MNEYFEIFRTGLHTDSKGQQKDWTEEDLNRIAAKYNEQKEHEAPLVIGHPEINHPAYGWVENLKVEGGKLLAKAAQIVPEFAEAIKTGLFKKRSISLYPDLLLRHVGFLGAVPPAVKGLKDIAFATTDDTEITEYEQDFDYAQSTDYTEVIKENAALKSDLAEKNLKVTELAEKLRLSESEFAELKNSQNKLQREFSEFKKNKEETDFKKELATKVASKAITPAQSEMILSFYAEIEKLDETTISFAEGCGPRDFLKNFVETLPRLIPDVPNIPGEEPEIQPVDVDVLAAKTLEYVDAQEKKGITVSFGDAVKIVKPQLLIPKKKE